MRKKKLSLDDIPHEGRNIKCLTCAYSHDFGAAKLNAEIAASRHRQKNCDHTVVVFRYHLVQVYSAVEAKEVPLDGFPF